MLLERGSLEGVWIIHLHIMPFKCQMYAKATEKQVRGTQLMHVISSAS